MVTIISYAFLLVMNKTLHAPLIKICSSGCDPLLLLQEGTSNFSDMLKEFPVNTSMLQSVVGYGDFPC